MKVVLFEISAKQNRASLHYRSGEPLTIEEIHILTEYLADLSSNIINCRPKAEVS